MKRIIVLFMLIPFCGFLKSQTPTANLLDVRHIEVTGSAQMEVAPDEFYLSIVAKEYLDDNKRKVTIDELEAKIKEAVTSSELSIGALTISSVESALTKYRRNKDKDLFLSKSYVLKITSIAQFEKVLNKLSSIQLAHLDLARTSNSEIEKYRLQVKVASVEAARKKAESMIAPLGAKLGKLIYVHEISDEYISPVDNRKMEMSKYKGSNMLIEESYFDDNSDASSISFRGILLKYSVVVRFEIE
jgi:uncharacterized protein YggE